MQRLLILQSIIVPDQIEVLKRRYDILRALVRSQPIGRRALAAQVGIGERVVRSDTDFLVKQGVVKSSRCGICVTAEGEDLLNELEQYFKMSARFGYCCFGRSESGGESPITL